MSRSKFRWVLDAVLRLPEHNPQHVLTAAASWFKIEM